MAYFLCQGISEHFQNVINIRFGSGIMATIYPLFDILKLITIALIIVGLARPQEISNSVRKKQVVELILLLQLIYHLAC